MCYKIWQCPAIESLRRQMRSRSCLTCMRSMSEGLHGVGLGCISKSPIPSLCLLVYEIVCHCVGM